MQGEWIEFEGGECPVDTETLVQVRLRSGDDDGMGEAGLWRWDDSGSSGDIVAYRVVSQPADDTKLTNPKDAIGSMKLPLHLLSPIVAAYHALAKFLGNVKYGAWNYIAGGARASVYKAALDRHMSAWWAGEDLDPEDGTPHLANALACLDILIECSEAGNLNDDRPPSTEYRRVRTKIEAMMPRILEQHGHRNPRNYTIADNAEIAESRK